LSLAQIILAVHRKQKPQDRRLKHLHERNLSLHELRLKRLSFAL
jgi:hypothetical protein